MPKKVEKPAEPKGYKKWSKFDSKWDGKFANPEENPLAIDKDVIAGLNREGLDLKWMRTSCAGQPDDKNVARHLKNGWVAVERGDIQGIDIVEEGGLQLVARPMAISKKARALEDAEAKSPVATKEMQLRGGDLPGITLDPRHPSAVRSNKINRTIERLEVPE
jgi:hypothetical protein